MKRIETTMKLPQDVLDIQKVFTKNGFKLFVVGGAVRDHLLGNEPHDFDLVTDTTPETVMEILKDYRTDLQGAHFGVVRVFTEQEKEGHEIASFRIDISKGRDTKGDDKKVEIGNHITIKDDVKRRDLTINALFYDVARGEIVDLVGGVSDLDNHIVRTVGNPTKRFNEDRLRILRAIRFAATTHSKIDANTLSAIRSDNRLFGVSEIDDVSKERIFGEFNKVKDKARTTNDATIVKRFVDLLVDLDIMSQLFPIKVTKKEIVSTHFLCVAVAQILIENEMTEGEKNILTEAKIPSKFVDIISILVGLFNNGVDITIVNEFQRRIQTKGVTADILTEWVKVMSITDKAVNTLLKYEPSVSGKDLLAEGFKGARLGEELRRRETDLFKSLM